MKYIYVPICAVLLLCAAYIAGVRNGKINCRVRVAAETADAYTHMIKQQEDINVETLRRSTNDIRDVLRTEYTIAE